MRATTTILFFCAFLLASPAFAQSVDFERDVLRAIDTVPTRAQLDAAFEDAPSRLRAAALDGERSNYERARAITLLSLYPTESTRAFLVELAGSDESEVAAKAVYTLAIAFGKSADAELVEFVGEKTRVEDHEVSEWAVRGLRWMEHPRALAILKRVRAAGDARLAPIAKRALRKHRLKPDVPGDSEDAKLPDAEETF